MVNSLSDASVRMLSSTIATLNQDGLSQFTWGYQLEMSQKVSYLGRERDGNGFSQTVHTIIRLDGDWHHVRQGAINGLIANQKRTAQPEPLTPRIVAE
jgi:hypothetical protein